MIVLTSEREINSYLTVQGWGETGLDIWIRRQVSSVGIAISTTSRSGRQYWHNSVFRWERDGQSSYVDNRLNYDEVPVNREIERSYGHYTKLLNSPPAGDIRAIPSARMHRVNFRDVRIVFDKKKKERCRRLDASNNKITILVLREFF